MKKLKTILIPVVCLIIIQGCEDVLDYRPVVKLEESRALTSTEGLEAAIIGTYDRLQSGYLYGGRIAIGGDIMADNVKKSGDYALVYEETQMFDKQLSPDNLITSVLWSDGYWVINQVNVILEAIPNVDDDEIDEAKNIIEGEALFIRGLMHFDLMRYFQNVNTGEAVPLITEPLSIEDQPFRATIEEVYTQVIRDLTDAANLLPESNKDRATKWAAIAILSRVHFYHGDYKLSIDAATDVIVNGGFELVDSVKKNFSETFSPEIILSPEIIFAIMSTPLDASCGTFNSFFRKASTPKFSPSSKLMLRMASEGAADQRLTEFFALIDNKWYTTKFDERYMNVSIIRLAELYLTRAECYWMISQNNNDAQALADLNIVKNRAGLTNSSFVNATVFFGERQKELFYEGDDFHNRRRLEKDEISIFKLPYNDVRLMYKIPQREIIVNPNLTQNE